MTILEEIAKKTKLRVEAAKRKVPPEKLLGLLGNGPAPNPNINNMTLRLGAGFEQALRQPGLSFICEVKKASPSKGIIAEEFPWLEIAREYEAAGAAAISVLTEPDYFLGSDHYLREISAAVSVPCLRKDFTIDPYQIYEAKLLGAQAVLLICALLSKETLVSFMNIARELCLSALVEVHTQAEIEEALEAGAHIIGINNRNLKTFTVDIEAGARLKESIPAGILTVAESGITTPADSNAVSALGFDAVLIGESLMKSADKKQFLADLRAGINR